MDDDGLRGVRHLIPNAWLNDREVKIIVVIFPKL
jgi:hypothetical protein